MRHLERTDIICESTTVLILQQSSEQGQADEMSLAVLSGRTRKTSAREKKVKHILTDPKDAVSELCFVQVDVQ